MRRFVSVWLPALSIERLTLNSPQLVPVDAPFGLVAGGPRGLALTAVNAAAQRLGLAVGLTLTDARAVVPDFLTHPADSVADAVYLEDLALWAGRYGPDRNTEGADGLWIEVTGVAHLYGGERLLAADLVASLARTGLTCRLALADTREGAAALARFATSTTVPVVLAPAGTLAHHLAPLSVAALSLAPDTLTLLARLGLSRIGLLYGLPRAALARRFRDALGRRKAAAALGEKASSAVLDRLDAALGKTTVPRAPLIEPPVYRIRLPFAEPLVTPTCIAVALDELARLLAARLEADGQGARAVRLVLCRVDGTSARADIATSRATRDPTHIIMLMTGRLEELDLGLGIDLAILEALITEPLAPVQSVCRTPELAGPDASALASLVDRLVNRLGRDQVRRLSPAPSHIPERAERTLSALDAPPVPPAHAASAELSTRGPPRPIVLVTPPEPISVVAEVPDGPPVRFVWRRVAHIVARADGPERIAPEWWRAIGKVPPGNTPDNAATEVTPPRPFTRTRDYDRVEDVGGGRYWVFRDGLYGNESEHASPAWYMHGLFA